MKLRKRIAFFAMAIVLLFNLSACGDHQTTPTWQEQYDLGMRYLSEGNYEEAIIAFTVAIEIDSKQALAYVGRGQAYVLSGETEENILAAQTDFETAAQLDESNPEAWLELAYVFVRQGDYEKALEIIQRGAECTDGNAAIAEKKDEIENLLSESSSKNDSGGDNIQTQDNFDSLNADFENLSVRVKDKRSASITISGLSLQDSYLTNLSTSGKNAFEYSWGVEMYGDQDAYSVSTSSWAFAPGEETTKSLADMQHSVWASDGSGFSLIGDAEMSYTPNSITWVFTVPEEYSFDFANVNRYEVTIEDISQNLSLRQAYTLR